MEAQPIRFLLNDHEEVATASPGMLALDYVRQACALTGSKEGCKEGDCGACTVIVGTLQPSGEVTYRPMTSCLLPLAELGGKHLVTIEGLNFTDRLSPMQDAMVREGGTQCGFCTPGFVVAMTAWLLDETKSLDLDGLKYAISGNLCRCTGYRPIKDAGVAVATDLATKLQPGQRIAQLCAHGAIPAYFSEVPTKLANMRDAISNAETPETPEVILAGGTDLYVQRGEEIPGKNVHFLLRGYVPTPAKRVDGRITVDARMNFEAFADDPIIRAALPQIADYNLLIASWPVRTRSTLGGNIGNASPIADMTCLLLALDAELGLRLGDARRSLPLKALFTGYKQLAKEPNEWIETITFAAPDPYTFVNWEKVSKRAWLDIATVNSAISLRVQDGIITAAHLALGGVAAIPLYLPKASAALVGQPLTPDTVTAMLAMADTEYQPIGDVRGSAEYKRLLGRNLIWAHFAKLFPAIFTEETLHAALR